MPVTSKDYSCFNCGSKNPKDFRGGRKTCCKECLKITTCLERRKLILLPYECKYCGDKEELNFYTYCKNKCKKHYNSIPKLVKTPIHEIEIKTVNAPRGVFED